MPRPLSVLTALSLCVAGVSPVAVATTNAHQAAASMHTWLFAAEGIATRCSKAFPEITKRITADLATWKRIDKVAIDRAEALWREMQVAVPRSLQEAQEDQEQLEQLWTTMSEHSPASPPASVKPRCIGYFHDRANGLLRARRPEVFQALEARSGLTGC